MDAAAHGRNVERVLVTGIVEWEDGPVLCSWTGSATPWPAFNYSFIPQLHWSVPRSEANLSGVLGNAVLINFCCVQTSFQYLNRCLSISSNTSKAKCQRGITWALRNGICNGATAVFSAGDVNDVKAKEWKRWDGTSNQIMFSRQFSCYYMRIYYVAHCHRSYAWASRIFGCSHRQYSCASRIAEFLLDIQYSCNISGRHWDIPMGPNLLGALGQVIAVKIIALKVKVFAVIVIALQSYRGTKTSRYNSSLGEFLTIEFSSSPFAPSVLQLSFNADVTPGLFAYYNLKSRHSLQVHCEQSKYFQPVKLRIKHRRQVDDA